MINGNGKEPIKLLIFNPYYGLGGPISLSQQLGLYKRHPDWEIRHFELSSSALTFSFNAAWCEALNRRDKDEITHFLMIHADIRPDGEDWAAAMMEEMERHQADVLSVISPIKDARGLTSTALDTDEWGPLRLTMAQVIKDYPETWTSPDLLFNTGLMLVDMSGDWVEQVFFQTHDKIARKDGIWTPFFMSEDWDFARQCNKLGVKSFVTRRVPVGHYGVSCWPNNRIWGERVDTANGQAIIQKRATPAKERAQASKIERALGIQGWMEPEELEWLAEQASKHTRIAEIGCWQGRSLRALADNTMGSVLAVDPWENEAGGEFHRDDLEKAHHKFLKNTSDLRNLVIYPRASLEAAAQYLRSGERFDMIFIDGDHRYESVCADIEAWRPLLAPGGLLCGHDYRDPSWPGVEKAVKELIPNHHVAVGNIWYAIYPVLQHEAAQAAQ